MEVNVGKNKVFINKIEKEINNNQKYCDVVEEIVDLNKSSNSNDSVEDKLEKLFNTTGYIFNTNVKIITSDKVFQTKIAGKVNNHLITMDNDIIDISSIKDIVY